MSRYKRRFVATNLNEMYEDHFKARDVAYIKQYTSPVLLYPTTDQDRMISFVSHEWSLGDKYHTLAYKYYDNPKLWWIIAQYNQAPTEHHLVEGQIVKIPFPLTAVYSYIGQV